MFPGSVFRPARALIHSGRMSSRMIADREHADDEQREDLLDESPGLPEEIADLVLGQSFASDRRQQDHRQNDPEHLAREQDVQAAGVRRHPGRGDEEREDDEAERDPGPTVEALGDLPQSAPGRRRDQEEQPDEDRPLHGDALLAFGGIDGNDPGQEFLETVEAGNGQRDLPVGVRQEADLERARQEQGDEDDQKDERGPFQRRFSREHRLGLLLMGRVRPAEDEGHDHPDADAEDERQKEAREGQVRTDHAAGIDQGQDIGRRARRRGR